MASLPKQNNITLGCSHSREVRGATGLDLSSASRTDTDMLL